MTKAFESEAAGIMVNMGKVRFIWESIVSILLFAACLATVITIAWKGLPIIRYGVPMCGLLLREGLMAHWLQTSCGCAVTELILLPLALAGLWVYTPRLIAVFYAVRAGGKKMSPENKQ